MTTRPEERVLTIPSYVLKEAGLDHGFHPAPSSTDNDFFWKHLLEKLFNASTVSNMVRSAHENNEHFRALVSYIVLRHYGWFYSYIRAKGSDNRLQAQRSIGFGGHANVGDNGFDGPFNILRIMEMAARRELSEEFDLRDWRPGTIGVKLAGLINDESNPVGRTHLGFVYVIDSPIMGLQFTPDAKAKDGEWMSPAKLRSSQVKPRHEHWSQILMLPPGPVPCDTTTWRAK